MATLTPVVATLAGADPLPYPTAAAGGDLFPALTGAKYVIHVINGHTASQDVVIDDQSSSAPPSSTAFDPDVTVSVPNAGERMILIRDPARFMDANGDINLSYPSGETALTLQVIRVV